MNKHSILHKLLIFIPTLIFSSLIFYIGNSFPKKFFFLEYIAIFLITFLGAVNCVLIGFARKKIALTPPKFSLNKVFWITKIYLAFVFILLISSVFFSGILYYKLPVVSSIFAIYASYMVYRFLFSATMNLEAASDCTEIDRESYPKIFEIAENAVKAVDLKGKVRLFSQWGFQPSATTIDDEIRIIFGTHIPALVNEYELEAIFVSELGLIKSGSITADSQIKKKIAHLQISFFSGNELFPNFFLLFPCKIVETKVINMINEAEKSDDTVRLKAILKYGIPTDYINASAKLTEYEFFLKTTPSFSIYSSETPPCDFQQRLVEEFKISPIRKNKKINELILNTEQCGFKMSISEKTKFLGCDGFSLDSDSISQSYISESENLLKLGSEQFYNYISPSFSESREKEYVSKLELTQKYESDCKKGELYNDTDKLEVALSYLSIAKPEEAEKIIDQILEASPTMANALFEKGRLLLARLDESGVELLIESTNYNRFIEQKAYFTIITFYYLLGDAENREKYLKILEGLSENEKSLQEKLFDISSASDYSDTDLSQSDLEEIRRYIKDFSSECVDLVLLANRQLEGEESVNIIFVKFSDNITEDERDSVMKKIHFYLDNRNENFYLFIDNQKEEIFHFAEESDKSVIIYKK